MVERFCAPRVLGDDDLGAACGEVGDDGVAVERLSAIGASKVSPSISGGTPIVSKRCPGSSTKRTRLPSGVGQCQDFGGHSAFRAADGLVLRPPFAPCP